MARLSRKNRSKVTVIKKIKIHWLMVVNFLLNMYLLGYIHKDKLELLIKNFK